MPNHRSGYIDLTRIIMAKSMKLPPDDVDMSAIFRCVQRSIEEKVERNLEEPILAPANHRERKAVISAIGETIIPMMFDCEYPFGDFVKNYAQWYEDNMAVEFLKMKIQALTDEKGT